MNMYISRKPLVCQMRYDGSHTRSDIYDEQIAAFGMTPDDFIQV